MDGAGIGECVPINDQQSQIAGSTSGLEFLIAEAQSPVPDLHWEILVREHYRSLFLSQVHSALTEGELIPF